MEKVRENTHIAPLIMSPVNYQNLPFSFFCCLSCNKKTEQTRQTKLQTLF